MQIIAEGIRSVFLWITIFIYELITSLYDIFEKLCKSRILDSEILNTLSQRIGMLLGIMMLFIVSFSVIQMILEPEKLTDKEKGIGNIAKKIILVIFMLGTSTFVFNVLYGIQSTIIDSHIISKFLLPNYEVNLENFGGVLSSELFATFFKPINPDDSQYKQHMVNLRSDIINYNDFSIATEIVNEGVGNFLFWSWGAYHIDFNWLLSPLLGLGALYFLFTYCITVGVRTIQLAFLEIISPMAIISYLSPKKDTMFEKWWKVYFATYIDVFIRIAIINLAVFLIAALLDNDMSLTFWNSVGGENADGATWIKIFMILAILTFAKKAPDLLKDLFPAGASKLGLGVSSPKNLFSNMLGGNLVESAARMGTVGTAIGLSNAITSGVSRFKINKKNGKSNWQAALGAAGGVFSGFGRGVVAGNQKGNPFSTFSKGVKAQRDLNDKYDELITSGGSTLGKIGAGLTAYFGETAGQTYTRHLNNLAKIDEFKKSMQDTADEVAAVKSAKDAWQQMTQFKGESLANYQKRKNDALAYYKMVRNGVINAALTDPSKQKRDTAGNLILTNDDGSIVKDLNGNQIIIEPDDVMYANSIKSTVTQANKFVDDHNVEYWDGNEYKKMGPISTRKELSDASSLAYETRTHIHSQQDYNAAIAQDKAAGVNSNGSGKN